jgi:hypothetical protein
VNVGVLGHLLLGLLAAGPHPRERAIAYLAEQGRRHAQKTATRVEASAS